jgi:DNA-binding XRE family transcriptional regulator
MTGEELKNLRKTLRLTQEQLAQVLGITRVTVIRSEKEGPSRMVQSFIDAALRAGKLGLSARELGLSMQEPAAEYGKKPSRKAQKKRS